jgi:hypothetical protein
MTVTSGASHSDTTATGANLNELVGGGSTTLHNHTRLICHLGKTSQTENIGGPNGTLQQIGWDLEIRKDTGFIHSNVTNNDQVTVDNAGVYRVTWCVSWVQGGSARTTIKAYPTVNGTPVLRASSRNYSRGQTYGDGSCNGSTLLYLSGAEVLRMETVVDDTDGVYVHNTTVAECEMIIERVEE